MVSRVDRTAQDPGRGRRAPLFVVSLLCLVTVALMIWQELGAAAPSYAAHQRRYQELARAAGRAAPTPAGTIHRLTAGGRVDRCLTCHQGIAEPPLPGEVQNPHRAHPGKLLTWHPPRRFGCTTCHGDGGGHVDRCLPATGEHGDGAPGLATARASCGRCHARSPGLSGAAALDQGLRAYRRLGCAGCHREASLEDERTRRRVGPPLDGVASKLRTAYLGAFLSGPQRKRPGTAMPTFFDDEAMAKAPAFSRQHVVATRIAALRSLLAFLLHQKHARATPGPTAAAGDASAGEKLAKGLGCVACHRLWPARSKATGLGAVGPDLSDAAARLRPGWVQLWLAGPRTVWAGARMPDLRLSLKARNHLAAYLATLGRPTPAPPMVPPAALAPAGKKLAQKLGCAGCHNLRALEGIPPAGPELDGFGDRPLEMLDWAHAPVDRSKRSVGQWIRSKLTTPLAFDRKPGGVLVMPWQRLRPGELDGLELLMRGLTRQPPPAGLKARPPGADHLRRQRGAELVRVLGCRQCHEGRGRGGLIKALLPRPSDRPPSLTGEGKKVLPGWLVRFLRRPTPLRPWLELRMPTFNITASQAGDVAAYLAAADGASFPFVEQPSPRLEGQALTAAMTLFGKLKCVSCHKLSNAPSLKPGELAPDLALSRTRLRRAWIRRFILEPQRLMPGTRMPTLFPLVDEDAPKGARITPAPTVMGGDVKRQVEALTDLNLLWGSVAASLPRDAR